MKFTNKDYFFIILYSSLLGFALYKLLLPHDGHRSPFEKIAEVKSLNGNSKTMSSSDLSWSSLQAGEPLGDGSKVFTLPDSGIIITFENGAAIELEQLSLVTLSKDSVEVESGSIKIISYGREGKININKKKITDYKILEKITILGSVQFFDAKNNMQIVSNRNAELEKLKNELIYDANVGLAMKTQEVSQAVAVMPQITENDPIVTSPVESSAISELGPIPVEAAVKTSTCKLMKGHVRGYLRPNGLKMNLFFDNIDKNNEYSIEFLDVNKKIILTKKVVQSNERFLYTNPQKPISFRLLCKEENYSGPIQINRLSQVQLIDKVVHKVSKDISEHQKIYIQWKPVFRSSGYITRIFIPDDKSIFKKIKELKVANPKLNFSDFDFGEFYFNVTAVDNFGDESDTSELGFIKLERRSETEP